MKPATSNSPVDDDTDNILDRSCIDSLIHGGRINVRNSMGNTSLPLQRSHRHVLQDGPPAGLPAVIAGKEHFQTATVRSCEVNRHRLVAVVALPDKAALPQA